MIKALISLFKSLLELALVFIKWLAVPVSIGVLLFVGIVSFFIIKSKLEGMGEIKKGSVRALPKKNIFKELLIELPYRIATDRIERNPDDFRDHGIYLYTGRQGMGKSIALCKHSLDLQYMYPEAKVIGNMGYRKQNEEIENWRDINKIKNGRKGAIFQIDEAGTWFSSKLSGSMPMSFLQMCCENRKQAKVLLMSAQDYYQIAKDGRCQCREERACRTYFHAFTIVHRYEHTFDQSGNLQKSKSLGYYWFVHNDRLRHAYDTFKVIEALNASDFKEDIPMKEKSL